MQPPTTSVITLSRCSQFDVLVIGSGIAGINAALTAAESGVSVCLACKGPLFSGSSFYPGTWGLGLIGPDGPEDAEDLIASIEQVGCGMADDSMVRSFVHGISPAIARLEKLGVRLRKAQAGAGQKEYIPCFDHKHRAWQGIEFDSVRRVLGGHLESLHVDVRPGLEALQLVFANNRVCGAVFSNGKALSYLGARSVVLATGGYGSLFRHHLCTTDVEGVGQSLALNVGCQLLNMEFMQIMPGYLRPAYGTVFNEKVFRFTELYSDGKKILDSGQASELLAVRSTHGPFTSRLSSKWVDLAIAAAEQPVMAHYSPELKTNPPEFVKTYFDWLATAKGLTVDDSIEIGLFSHAANGGIRIDENAFTGVSGLYAAGEVTGGMHGADRIGGLSTANGLVFGGKAGAAASKAARAAADSPEQFSICALGTDCAAEVFRQLQQIMTAHALVGREEQGLTDAIAQITRLSETLKLSPTEDAAKLTATFRIRAQLQTALCVLHAQLLRRESRGSHFRRDYPEQSPSMNHIIGIRKGPRGIETFEYV